MLLLPYKEQILSVDEKQYFNTPYLLFLQTQKISLQKQLQEAEILYRSSLATEEFSFLKRLKTRIRFLRTSLQVINAQYKYNDVMKQLLIRIENEQQRLQRLQKIFHEVALVRKRITEKLGLYIESDD